MWHDTVLKADTMVGRLLLGFLNTCSDHPLLSMEFLAVMVTLAVMLWVEMLKAEREPEAPRPIRLRR